LELVQRGPETQGEKNEKRVQKLFGKKNILLE
jgi:hypothetical protein